MKYEGILKKSRTLDLAMLSQIVDAVGLAFLAYSPEQLGVTTLVYFVIRVGLNGLQAFLRFKTVGPVGEK